MASLRAPAHLRLWLRALVLGWLLLAAQCFAMGVQVEHAALASADEHYLLDAQFNVELPAALEDAVTRGVTLVFSTEFRLTRPRRYWLDENVASATQTVRLSYHALTRQYRVARGPLHQNFSSLREALAILGSIRNWAVVDRPELQTGRSYIAEIRMSLDVTQMPKPFQVYAISNRDWSLASDPYTWIFSPGAAK